jgi:transposase
LHELPASERGCGVCGGELKEMTDQAEEAEEITVLERRFVIVRHQRQKYRCSCNANVVTADGPPKLQAGSRYAPEFALEVAASKYLDHLPLERQVRIMAREGLVVDSQTLWDQIQVLAQHLTPTYEALGKLVLGAPLLHADETWWRLMGQAQPKRWWVWAVATRSAAFYRILDSRSQQAGREMLKGYQGKVMADGYGAYAALGRDGPGFVLAHCWAHVRRKFVEIEETYPKACREILDLIGELYGVEALVPALRANATPEEEAEILRLRAELREQRSRAIVRRIQEWVYAQQPLPRSGLGSALTYLKGMWAGLTLVLEDPQIPLDNNLIERGLRGPALGRKNHYGSRSKRGAEVAAIFYSLFESGKLCGVEPKGYVLKATHAALAEPGTVTLPQSLLN